MKYAVCALIRDKGKVLSVTRKDDHDDYGLPGGKVDPGENCEEALVREVEEETGITVSDYYHCYSSKSHGRTCRTYMIKEWEGPIETDEDGLVEWVDMDFLKKEQHTFHKYNRGLLKDWRF